jgi:DNA-binding transcriptional ArsR family regulator
MVKERPTPGLDRVFQALSHPVRRAMLRRLAAGELNLGELATPFKMSFPAASKHVRVLERAHLVRRRITGREHVCRIEPKPLAAVNDWLEGYRELWDANFRRLDDLLVEMESTKPSEPNKR